MIRVGFGNPSNFGSIEYIFACAFVESEGFANLRIKIRTDRFLSLNPAIARETEGDMTVSLRGLFVTARKLQR